MGVVLIKSVVSIVVVSVIIFAAGIFFNFIEIEEGPSLKLGSRIFSLSGAGAKEETVSAPKLIPVKPVKLFKTQASSRDIPLILPAVIEAAQESDLSFDISGKLIELNVVASDQVKEGDVIARIDGQDLQNAVAEAQAEFDNAEAEFQRGVRLLERQAIARSQVETRQTARDVALAVLNTAKKNLSDTTLKAPFDGVVADVPVEQFQTVAANERIVILQTAGVTATVNVPADLLVLRRQFEPAEPTIVLDSLPDQTFTGSLFEAEGVADNETQTYKARFFFTPSQDLFVLPGMTATVRTVLQFSDSDSRLAPGGVRVPISSVVSVGEDLFVWVYDEQSQKIDRRSITVAEGLGDFVTVTEGLSPGETIVAAGGASLGQGAKVKPWFAE